MTQSQLKGMLRFHKSAYKAYKASGNVASAKMARAKMIELYLQLRKERRKMTGNELQELNDLRAQVTEYQAEQRLTLEAMKALREDNQRMRYALAQLITRTESIDKMLLQAYGQEYERELGEVTRARAMLKMDT